ncbi:MAG: DUF3048 domain-containing protein [Bacilli bacterium]|nr:DUF3048 domain-containing protein [Bacilli bacterium]
MIGKTEKQKKLVLIILGALVLIFLGAGIYTLTKQNKTDETSGEQEVTNDDEEEQTEEDNTIKIVDLNSNSRPIAVMINNHNEARPYQSGIMDAYLVYEMQVEAGITRLMAVFKDKDTTRIGSVRSARHTYLDYVMENDAIYVHYGWSYVAEAQVPQLGINNINGLYDNYFWRDSSLPVAYEHTAFTSMAKIKEAIANKGYRNTTEKDTLLNYVASEVDLSANEKGVAANTVTLTFSSATQTMFKYDSTNQNYQRYVNGKITYDYLYNKVVTFKNIIAIKVNNWTMSNTTLQDFDNLGEGDGYYITDGYSTPIKWYKESRSSQTVYKDLSGNEIEVNDGNTYIGIIPLSNSFAIN